MRTFFVQPLITEKSIAKSAEGVYQFIVPVWATKQDMHEMVSRYFGVTVVAVTTARIRGDQVNFKRRSGQQATYKKATVRLKKGDTIPAFSLPETGQSEIPSKEVSPSNDAPQQAESKITVRSKSKKTESAS